MHHASAGALIVYHRGALATALRSGAVLTLLAATMLPWPASAQDSGSAPLTVPDLTVTAEDPLILLPPLGPPVNQAPLAAPPADRRRAAYRDTPAVTAPGFGPIPPPAVALGAARSVQVVEGNAEFTAAAGVVGSDGSDGMDALRAIPVSVAYRNDGQVPAVLFGLSGLVPLATGVAGDVSAHAGVEFPAWRGSVAGALTVADLALADLAAPADRSGGDPDRAGQVVLSGGAGPLSAALYLQHWQAPPAAAEWRVAVVAEAELITSTNGPHAAVGVAAGRTGEDLFALPVARLSYGGKPSWRLAAGVRPILGYPRRLHRLIRDEPAGSEVLRPEQGWLAWLGAGAGAIDLRVGWAHGVSGLVAVEPTGPAAAPGLLLFGLTAETEWNTATGPVTAAARAGANWDRRNLHWRLAADGEWQVASAPPIFLLVGARWIEHRDYQGVFPDEDWTLAVFRDEPRIRGDRRRALGTGMGTPPARHRRRQLRSGGRIDAG